MANYAGVGVYDQGTRDFAYPPTLPTGYLRAAGTVGAGLPGRDRRRRFLEHQTELPRQNVYIVVGGTGSLTVTRDGKTTTVPISGPPTSHEIVAANDVVRGPLDVGVSKGLQVFSFTYG